MAMAAKNVMLWKKRSPRLERAIRTGAAGLRVAEIEEPGMAGNTGGKNQGGENALSAPGKLRSQRETASQINI
jgi:hypothetical protein